MSDAEKWRVSEHSLFGKRYIRLERWINSPAHWAIVAVIPVSDIDTASRLALARALVSGWAVVPREATEAMETACIKASLAFLIAHKIKAIWPWSRNRSHVRENIRVCYRAMVRAVEVPE